MRAIFLLERADVRFRPKQDSVAGLCAAAATICLLAARPAGAADLRAEFRDPPFRLGSVPFWHMNGRLTTEEIASQLRASRDKSGFAGVAVLPVSEFRDGNGRVTSHSTAPGFLTDEYFDRYRDILETAHGLGMEVILYDDINFPSGSAGGRMRQRFPGDCMKRLDKAETEVVGPARHEAPLPGGELMAAVAMRVDTKKRVDLSGSVRDGALAWDAPPGRWSVMVFTCVDEGNGLVDYLSPESVDRFIALTYEEYARRFPEHMGSTVMMSFFDDVAVAYARGYRAWTPEFNEKFAARFGFDPGVYYPALWHDIGPETAAARVALFGFRAELMSEGFVRKVHEWGAAHGILSSGHPMGPYDPQPVDIGGDNILFHRHADVPLVDSIHYYGHGRPGFKLVTSAAFTFDRPLAAVEIYGNYPERTVDGAMLYRSGMELYARGANFMIPHGMWYDPRSVRIPPLISHFSGKLGPELARYNRYVARCGLLLQGGRHVADVGVPYPVASLRAFYTCDAPGNRRFGFHAPPEADYLAVSDALTGHARRDFTFLHPDAVDRQCSVRRGALRMRNRVNREEYRVFMMPGGDVIRWSNLQMIGRFLDSGGLVIATTRLPRRSAEFGRDGDVARVVREKCSATSPPTLRPEPAASGSSSRGRASRRTSAGHSSTRPWTAPSPGGAWASGNRTARAPRSRKSWSGRPRAGSSSRTTSRGASAGGARPLAPPFGTGG